jgi:hypothetical protein
LGNRTPRPTRYESQGWLRRVMALRGRVRGRVQGSVTAQCVACSVGCSQLATARFSRLLTFCFEVSLGRRTFRIHVDADHVHRADRAAAALGPLEHPWRHQRRGTSDWPSDASGAVEDNECATSGRQMPVIMNRSRWPSEPRTSTSSGSGASARHQMPRPALLHPAPSQLANRWSDTTWPSARVHSAQLASLPAAFPGVDQTECSNSLSGTKLRIVK